MTEESDAWADLARYGYNWALSDTEDACDLLDHPELTKERDPRNYHDWAKPYPRRCYCGAIAYTDKGRIYACEISEAVIKIHKSIFGDRYPDGTEIRNRCGEPYTGKKEKAAGE